MATVNVTFQGWHDCEGGKQLAFTVEGHRVGRVYKSVAELQELTDKHREREVIVDFLLTLLFLRWKRADPNMGAAAFIGTQIIADDTKNRIVEITPPP